MGTSSASIWLVLTGSSLPLARAICHELGFLFLSSFFYVSFAEWVCWDLVCFLHVKVKFQGEDHKSAEPAQEFISCCTFLAAWKLSYSAQTLIWSHSRYLWQAYEKLSLSLSYK